MLGRTAASHIIYDFLKERFLGGGNVKCFTEANFILMSTKIATVNQKNCHLIICIQFKLIYGAVTWDINKYMTKSCPSSKSGKTSYLGIGQKLDRPFIHTHHNYMYEHISFRMFRAQMIRICSVEMKIWGCTHSLFWHIFKMVAPKKNAEKNTFPYLNI